MHICRMRIALVGEYSEVHANLASGLRGLGHDVVTISGGDGWKGYARDVDLSRSGKGKLAGLAYAVEAWRKLRDIADYDVVQIINPVFLDLRAERIGQYYRMLRRRNRKLVLGAYGVDHYYVQACLDGSLKRSDLSYRGKIRQIKEVDLWTRDWIKGAKGRLNVEVAEDCDAIAAGLPEYYIAYKGVYGKKLSYIALPVRMEECKVAAEGEENDCKEDRVRFFVGIQRGKDEFKGTDILLRALKRLEGEMPEVVEVRHVVSVPFAEYSKLMDGCDVVLDQLYGYGPAMNGLLAMSKGKVVVTGLEEETYGMLGEDVLRPLVGVEPEEDAVVEVLRGLAQDREKVERLGRESREYAAKHHAMEVVARQYEALYDRLLRE